MRLDLGTAITYHDPGDAAASRAKRERRDGLGGDHSRDQELSKGSMHLGGDDKYIKKMLAGS